MAANATGVSVLAVKNFEVGVTISRRRLTTVFLKTRELTIYLWAVSLDFSVDLTTTSSATAQVLIHYTSCLFSLFNLSFRELQ
jgi:hypothetical protein